MVDREIGLLLYDTLSLQDNCLGIMSSSMAYHMKG